MSIFNWYLPTGAGTTGTTSVYGPIGIGVSHVTGIGAAIGNNDLETARLRQEIEDLKTLAREKEKEKENMPRLSDIRERTDLYLYDTAEFTTTKYPAVTRTERTTEKIMVPGHLGLGEVEEERTTERVIVLEKARESAVFTNLRLFGNANVCDRSRTNMLVPGQLASDAVAVLKSIEFSAPPEVIKSWAGCHWTLQVGQRDQVTAPISSLKQISSSALATVFEYSFDRAIVVAARQAFSVMLERFNDVIPQGQMKVALRGVLTRDCL